MTYWTKKKPTKPGWYWKRDRNGDEIVQVRDYVGELCILNWALPNNVEWAGPIPEPEEKK